jgi:hypothetical protein
VPLHRVVEAYSAALLHEFVIDSLRDMTKGITGSASETPQKF